MPQKLGNSRIFNVFSEVREIVKIIRFKVVICTVVPILAGIGALALLNSAYFVVRFLAFHLVVPARPLKTYKRDGPEPTYALITGSSAGIGLGVAQALVKEGFAVILLGHVPDELKDAKATLLKLRPDAVVRIIVMDARTATPDEMDAAVKSIADLQVSILVNNVGGCPIALPAFRQIQTYSCADIDAVINMNARFMARLTSLMIPILTRKSKPEDRSLLLNMSSAGMVGVPWLTMYGATKAFNWGFSSGVGRELQAYPETNHIDCLVIIPNEVRSQGNSQGVSESEPRWDDFGQSIVNKVDNAVARGQRDLAPSMMHDIQIRLFAVLPEGLRTIALTDAMAKKRNVFNAVHEKIR